MGGDMDSALELFQRRFDELLAILGIFGHDILAQASPEDLFASLLAGGTDADSASQLSTQPVVLSLQVFPGGAAADAGGGNPSAVLHVTLPPAYPSQCCACSVSSSVLSKCWQAAASGRLQALAEEAAAQGRECLFELLQDAQEQVSVAQATAPGCTGDSPEVSKQQQERQQSSSPAVPRGDAADGVANAGGTMRGSSELPRHGPPAERRAGAGRAGPLGADVRGGAGSVPGTPLQLALLRLDHMHDRRRYCRTVRRWCGELGLTGRLLFLGGLILVLLEGDPGDVKECLSRWRTQSVDVDSKGRPCKERMMNVQAEEPRRSRYFSAFKELDLASFEELRQVLEAAGAAQWLSAATSHFPTRAERGQGRG